MVSDEHGVQCGQFVLSDHSVLGWLPHGLSGVVVQVRVLACVNQLLDGHWDTLKKAGIDRWMDR